jgi:hypothetical protein
MTIEPSRPPPSLVDAIRGRVATLFPDWSASRIEPLVHQMAAIEWKYLVRNHGMPIPPVPRRTPKS